MRGRRRLALQSLRNELLNLLVVDGRLSAVIDFGTTGGMQAVKPFAKSANLALRNMYGEDLRPLAFKALEEATRALGGTVLGVTLENAA